MPQQTITIRTERDTAGANGTAFSVALSDESASYGAKRLDGSVVVPAGTPMVQDGGDPQLWTYDLPNLAAGAIIDYSVHVVWDGGGSEVFSPRRITIAQEAGVDCAQFDYTEDQLTYLRDAGESITYLPGGVEPGRSICAVIDRQQMSTLDGFTAGRARTAQIEIANDPTNGVSSQELNKGTDQFRFPNDLGGELHDWTFEDILDQDKGMMVLLLRW